MQEQLIKWEPVSGLSEKYAIEFIGMDDFERCFKIIFIDILDRKNKIAVRLDCYPDIFRITKTECNASLEWTFFKVINSSYIQWLLSESFFFGFINKTHPFTHYSFVATNFILDVVSSEEPKVEVIE